MQQKNDKQEKGFWKKIRSVFSSGSEAPGLEQKFNTIYEKNLFEGKESISGPGSDLQQTEKVRAFLPGFFLKYKIRSMVDAPCGDFYWMQHVDFGDVHYTGVDIVQELTEKNTERFGSPLRRFVFADIVNSELPKADVIFCRDCLVHLDYEQALKAIANFKRSGATYLLTTTFPARKENRDLGSIIWRPLNLMLPPFSLPEPLELFNEGCTENQNRYTDKSLGLWRLDDIVITPVHA